MKTKLIIVFSVLFIFAGYTMKADKSEVTIPKWDRFVEITGSYVNLRMEPGIEGEKLIGEHFAKGEVAPLLDETDEWAKVYYAYSPTQYVWLSKQFTREVKPQPLPDEYRFTTYQTYGDQMLTYVFGGKPTNIVYSGDYPFDTTKTWADEPNLYRNSDPFMSALNTDIYWQTVMSQIIKAIPDDCVNEYFVGVPLLGRTYNFRTDHETKIFKSDFEYEIYLGDILYQLKIYALPTHDPDQLLVIVLNQSGLDFSSTDLIKSMRYNIKTGKLSDIRDGLPGVVTDKLGLNYNLFQYNPEYQREARQSPTRNFYISYFLGIPMARVSGEELSLSYPIDTYDIPQYTEKTSVYYLWDGDKFVKMVRSPYIDLEIIESEQQNF